MPPSIRRRLRRWPNRNRVDARTGSQTLALLLYPGVPLFKLLLPVLCVEGDGCEHSHNRIPSINITQFHRHEFERKRARERERESEYESGNPSPYILANSWSSRVAPLTQFSRLREWGTRSGTNRSENFVTQCRISCGWLRKLACVPMTLTCKK